MHTQINAIVILIAMKKIVLLPFSISFFLSLLNNNNLFIYRLLLLSSPALYIIFPKNRQTMHIKFHKSQRALPIDNKKISSTNKQKTQDQMLRY